MWVRGELQLSHSPCARVFHPQEDALQSVQLALSRGQFGGIIQIWTPPPLDYRSPVGRREDTHLWRPGPPWTPEVQLSVPASDLRVRSMYLLAFLPVSKFSLRAVSLVKTGHPFRPPPTNSLHKWGRNRAGWGSRLRGGGRKEPSQSRSSRAAGEGRRKEKARARGGRASLGRSPPLCPLSRARTGERFARKPGAAEACAAPRAASPLRAEP